MSRRVTIVPQRSQAPSTTCSLASTVLHEGHQLAGDLRLVGQALACRTAGRATGSTCSTRGSRWRLRDSSRRRSPASCSWPRMRSMLRIGPGEGMDAVLDRRALGRQAKGVEADGMHDVEALHALEAGEDVGRAVVVPVADVQVARGIGIHDQRVVLLPRVVFLRLVEMVGRPPVLPLGLDLGWLVLRAHLSAYLRK